MFYDMFSPGNLGSMMNPHCIKCKYRNECSYNVKYKIYGRHIKCERLSDIKFVSEERSRSN